MEDIEAYDMLTGHNTEKKSLTSVLKEMGFKEDSYMVINRHDPQIKVTTGEMEDHGTYKLPKADEYASFGGEKDFKEMDEFDTYQAQNFNHGHLPAGYVGSNNGLYAARAFHGDELIITKDPEIAHQLQSQLGFKDGLGVPMSNGGIIIDREKRFEFDHKMEQSAKAPTDRLRGLRERPKHVKSPFRDDKGKINEAYAKLRSDKLTR